MKILGLILLPLLLGAASALPVNYTGNNSTLNGTWDWQASTGATLTFTAGNLSDLSISANGSEVWNWSQRVNVTGASVFRTVMVDYPDQQDPGPYIGRASYERRVWFAPVPDNVEVWVQYIPRGVYGAYYSMNFTVSEPDSPVSISNVTWNSRYNFTGNNSTTSLLSRPSDYVLWIPLNRNGTLVQAGPGMAGYVGEGTVSPWTGRASGPPFVVTLGASPLPLRINATGNFSVVGSVSTDEVWVWPWAMVNGQNVSATMNLSGGGRTFSVPTENWTAIKPGTYSASANWTGKDCLSGPVTVTLTANGSSFGCVVVAVPPPSATPAPAPAAGGGGAAGGGAAAAAPAPEAPAPGVVVRKSLGEVPATGGQAKATFEQGPVGSLTYPGLKAGGS